MILGNVAPGLSGGAGCQDEPQGQPRRVPGRDGGRCSSVVRAVVPMPGAWGFSFSLSPLFFFTA